MGFIRNATSAYRFCINYVIINPAFLPIKFPEPWRRLAGTLNRLEVPCLTLAAFTGIYMFNVS